MESFVPVVELLQSGLMSSCVLLLQHEAPPLDGPTNNGEGKEDKVLLQPHTMENAARIALLLTRSFVAFISDTLSETSHEDLLQYYLSTLHLGNFFANIGDHNTDNATTSPPTCNGNANASGGQKCTLLGIQLLAPIRVNSQRDQQERVQQEQRGKDKAILQYQILGKLLYLIFSLGESPPLDLLGTTIEPSATQNNGCGKDEQHRSSKKSSRDTSLFSRLIESKAYPISICRLLSDLIDIDRAHSPFRSFEEIIQDLENMTCYAQIFLHDPLFSQAQGVPQQPPVFGQVYHGRNEEIATLLKVAVQMEESATATGKVVDAGPKSGLESVFVSGIAGSGKSHLVQTVEDYLSCLGWIVTNAKFERSAEHTSRGILSSMFDKVISDLVKMKNKEGGNTNQSDVEYVQRVSKSILDGIGSDGLSRMVVFLPSIPLLFEDIGVRSRSISPLKEAGEYSTPQHVQLIFGLSTILEAVLESDRFILICADDLQWADRTSINFITELLISLASIKHMSRQCLFVGLYREDEVRDELQKSFLQNMSSLINTSEIKLLGLSKVDVADMLTTEFRLPRRIVEELANIVWMKTAGHAYFVMELLNSLLRDSIITYSSVKRRYEWDIFRIEFIQMGDSVAELISRNFASLPSESQRMLHILACFGIQTDDTLLQILGKYKEGLVSSIGTFVEKGFLDRAGPIVIFAHDLIQQAVYESMSLEQRQVLHLDIGTFLGETSRIDDSFFVTRGMGRLQLKDRSFFAGRSITSPLIAIACDGINLAVDAVTDKNQRLKFAEWNLSAGQKSTRRSNYRAALYYFRHGINFLGEECWSVDNHLCLELHEGVVLSSFALGEAKVVEQCAKAVEHHVPFEDALETQRVYLFSLTQTGKHKDSLSKGVELLRQLDFNIPLSPNKESVVTAMASANGVASQYSCDQIMRMCENAIDNQVKSVGRIMDALIQAAYEIASPYLPLITCELVKYLLNSGAISSDACGAFASFGVLKVSIEGDYRAGRFWSEVVRAILEKYKAKKKSGSRTLIFFEARWQMLLYLAIDIWFNSPKIISQKLLEYHQDALGAGQTDLAIISIRIAWRYKLMGGEHLSLIYRGSGKRLKEIASHNKNHAKIALLDSALLFELMGKTDDHFSLVFPERGEENEGTIDTDSSIRNMNDLQKEAESTQNNQLLHHLHICNMLLSFWRDDFLAAEKSDAAALKFPMLAKKPEIFLIYHTFFRGLIALRLYRQYSGHNRLKEGREVMDKFRCWTHHSKAPFENKWLLLKAEYNASFQGSDDAAQFYIASINAARDHGNIHEMALAYELLGNYYDLRKCNADAKDCYNNAYICYTRWGASAIAEKLMRKHELDENGPVAVATKNNGLQAGKHSRSREGG